MKRLLNLMPKKVLISVGMLVGCIVGFAILYPTLGAARDTAIMLQDQLTMQIGQTTQNINTAANDEKYVHDNLERYESLMKSDRLIPHTRRAAVVRLQEVARVHGLSSMNYSFSQAGMGVARTAVIQPTAGAYKLSAEVIELKLGAPIDGAIYGFISDITEAFPGAAVVENVSVKRASRITDAALDAVSKGQDSRLVEAELQVSWRTAQAVEQQDQSKAK